MEIRDEHWLYFDLKAIKSDSVFLKMAIYFYKLFLNETGSDIPVGEEEKYEVIKAGS